MESITDNVESCKLSISDDKGYFLKDLKKHATKIFELDSSCWLTLYSNTSLLKDGWVYYSMFEQVEADTEVVAGVLVEKDIKVEELFHGDGPTGSLKELRHTYFANEGYIFYLPMEATIKALTILQEYFND